MDLENVMGVGMIWLDVFYKVKAGGLYKGYNRRLGETLVLVLFYLSSDGPRPLLIFRDLV